MKNKKKNIAIIAVIVLLLAGLAYAGYRAFLMAKEKYIYIIDHLDRIEENGRHYDFDYSWAEENVLVAHAMGAYEGNTYTNALQAFEYNYDLGYRVFEVDFDLSTDYYLICSHREKNWREISQSGDDIEYSLENFKSIPVCGNMDTLDGKDIIELMVAYPDIYIITDNKYTDEYRIRLQFTQLVSYAMEISHPEVLDRVIPQIYHEKMLGYVMDIYPFKSVIYTVYKDPDWQTDTLAVFFSRTGVGFITMWAENATQERIDIWNKFGIRTAAHTVNEPEEARELLDRGVNMLYTDYLLPEDFKKE